MDPVVEGAAHEERGSFLDNAADKRRPKRAAALALELEREIIGRGWPVGEMLGSESELLERYSVSRAVFREAVRLLEHSMVAKMRRGPGGGLIVTAPSADSVAATVALYLEYQRVDPSLVFDARRTLELSCVQMAAENITEEGIARLRSLLEEESRADPTEMPVHSHDFHLAVAELSENSVMHMFIHVLTRLTRERAVLPENIEAEAAAVHHAHSRIAEAIIAGDASLARHRLLRHLNAVATYVH